MANYNSMISEWIKEKRIEKGWKQEQLGEKVGVTKTAVSYWESGKRSVSAEMFVSICKALDANPQELIIRMLGDDS